MNISKRTFNPLHGRDFRFKQSEDAELTYYGNWGPFVQPNTVSSSEWTVESGNAILSSENLSGNTTSVKISGTHGENVIINTVVLDNGDVDERRLLLKILKNDEPYINDDYGIC